LKKTSGSEATRRLFNAGVSKTDLRDYAASRVHGMLFQSAPVLVIFRQHLNFTFVTCLDTLLDKNWSLYFVVMMQVSTSRLDFRRCAIFISTTILQTLLPQHSPSTPLHKMLEIDRCFSGQDQEFLSDLPQDSGDIEIRGCGDRDAFRADEWPLFD
jgi:hypothetical protein